MFLCVCWMSPKISSAMLGGVASMSGGDLTGVGMGVGMAAVGAGVLATGYAARGSDALSKVKEAVAAGSRGPGGGGRTERAVRHPRQVEEAGGMETDQAPQVGEDLPLQRKTDARWRNSTRASVASSCRARIVEPTTRPATLRGGWRSKTRCSVRSNVRQIRAHDAMNSVRIPHDGPSHAPPSSSTGHGDS